MGTELEHFAGTATLEELKQRIRGKENGFELITLARGRIAGDDVNLATFRALGMGTIPPPVTLVAVAATLSLAQQDAALVAGAGADKRLISYAEVFVAGQRTNVAVYRLNG
jgi:hypothetical protein